MAQKRRRFTREYAFYSFTRKLKLKFSTYTEPSNFYPNLDFKPQNCLTTETFIYTLQLYSQGRSDGGISVFIPPKSAQVNFLWGNKKYFRL